MEIRTILLFQPVEAIEDVDSDNEEPKPKPILLPPVIKPILKTPRTLKLGEITKSLEEELREKLAVDAVKRILDSEKDAAYEGALRVRMKIITSIATTFGLRVREGEFRRINLINEMFRCYYVLITFFFRLQQYWNISWLT